MQTSTRWQLVYDAASTAPSGIAFPVIGVVLVAIAVIRLRWPIPDYFTPAERSSSQRPRRRFFLGAVVWTMLTALATILPHLSLARTLRAGEALKIEGVVEQFEAGSALRKRPERWVVAGRRYEFTPAVSKTGFNEMGVVSPGQRVRISDVRGSIARLEVAR